MFWNSEQISHYRLLYKLWLKTMNELWRINNAMLCPCIVQLLSFGKKLISGCFQISWLHRQQMNKFTLNCLFSSRNLWTSNCSLLHSSITFFNSLSSEELNDFDITEDSVFNATGDIILFISISCCWENGEKRVI